MLSFGVAAVLVGQVDSGYGAPGRARVHAAEGGGAEPWRKEHTTTPFSAGISWSSFFGVSSARLRLPPFVGVGASALFGLAPAADDADAIF